MTQNPNNEKAMAIRLIVHVQPGPALPAQKAAWRKFWVRIISESKAVGTEGQALEKRELTDNLRRGLG